MSPPVQLPTHRLGKDGPQVSAIGFGAMGISIGYGSIGSDEDRLKVLDSAWENGATHWDTADAYGDSEDLIGKWFKLHPERRPEIFLATKFGLRPERPEEAGTGKFNFGAVVDSSPEHCREAAESSLKRLGVDCIDLYYVHRLNDQVPVEKTVEAMVQLKREGKVRHLGLSECTSRSLRRAHAVAPIAAVQVEYNPWDLDIEGAAGTHLLSTCRELGVSVVCYSPLGKGFMTGAVRSRADMDPSDTRLFLPRYSEENFHNNLELADKFKAMAAKKGCTPGQLALAWLLAQGDDILPIPGTKRVKYLEENVGAAHVNLTPEEEKSIRAEVEKANIKGERGMAGYFTNLADTCEL